MASNRQGTGESRRALVLAVVVLLTGLIAAGAAASPAEPSARAADHVIVALGDSYASGQGTDRRDEQLDPDCDRSRFSGIELVAQQLEQENPATSIELINVTCAGAKITGGGVLDPQEAQKSIRAPQIRAAQRRLLAHGYTAADVDAVVVGIGGNDVGFADLGRACFAPGKPCFKKKKVASKYCPQDSPVPCFGSAHAELVNRYQHLAGCLANSCAVPGAALPGTGGLGIADSTRIVLTEYPNLTQGGSGETCSFRIGAGLVSAVNMTRDETRYSRDQVLRPLNQAGVDAAARNGWGYAGGVYDAATPHGFCAGSGRWVYWVPDVIHSVRHKETEDHGYVTPTRGILHPNRAGQLNYACRIYLQVRPRLDGVPVTECPLPLRPEPPTIPAKFLGTWNSTGPVDQPGSSNTYWARLTLHDGPPGSVVGQSYYPGLECTGALTLLRVRPKALVVREDITAEPQNDCVDTGTITLVPVDGLLSYSFVGGGVFGTAELAR